MATAMACLDSISSGIGHRCLPVGLGIEDMQCLENIVERSKPAHAGDHLFRVGDPLKALYAVRAGIFKSYIVDDAGREHVRGFHLPGEFLGFDAIYFGKHVSNAVALDTSAVCAISYSRLVQLANVNDGLRNKFFRLMSRNITELAVLAGDYSAEERIAAFLMDLSKRFHVRGCSPDEFNLAMSRRDIGNYLRLAPETVTRVLRSLKERSLISTDHRKLRLCDRAKLWELARCLL